MTSNVDISNLSIDDTQNDEQVNAAASRLAQEAQQALHLGSRGVTDITREFTAASNQLPPGELVKDAYFTLFDAVSALEITDPKMDSGIVPPGDTFDPDFDPCSSLDAKQVLWIMDQLLCLEITWHGGYPLSQTIFTSLHIDRLTAHANKRPYTFYYGREVSDASTEHQLVHNVLRAYCIGLIKSCQLVLYWVKAQTFFEEEDFVAHLYGRDLLPGVSSKDACDLLEQAEKLVSELRLGQGVQEALTARLRFRRFYLESTDFEVEHWQDPLPQLLQSIDQSHHLGQETSSAFSEKVQRLLASSTPPRPIVAVSWEEAIKQWDTLFADMAFARELIQPPVIHSPHCLQRATWAFAYRNPQPGTFVRARIQNLLFDEQAVAHSVPHYDLLLSDIRDLVLAGDTLADPESFRVEVTSDPRHVCSRIMEQFLDKALEEYLNFYRMVCQNRCRMRRTFAQSIAILDALETEAQNADEQLSRASPHLTTKTLQAKPAKGNAQHNSNVFPPFRPLTSWTKFYKLRMMAWTIQLGFETDIYLPDELGGMYWFLSRISAERGNLLDYIQNALVERMRAIAQASASSSSSSPTSEQGEAALMECLESQDWLRSLTLYSDLTQTLAQALWRLYTALKTCKVIDSHRREFAKPELLYELRFKSFLHVSNDALPSAEEFERAQGMQGSLATACATVEEDVRQARALLAKLKGVSSVPGKYVGTEEGWKKDIKQLETSCVAVAVAVSQLSRVAEKNGKKDETAAPDLSGHLSCEVPPPGKTRYHDWWIVPVLKEKKG